MASPKRKRLKKIYLLRKLRAQRTVEEKAEELPLMVDEPVVEEEKATKKEEKVVEKKKPVAKKSKKAAKKGD